MTDVPLRVAYVLVRPPSYSETFVLAEMAAVRDAGARVETFVAAPNRSRVGAAARVVSALVRHPGRVLSGVRALGFTHGVRGWLAAAHAVTLARRVAVFAPDVVHAHFVNLPTATALLVGRELGVPVTAVAHAADFLLDRDRTALARRIGRLSHLFVISAATAGQLAARGVPMADVPHSVVRAAFDGVTPPRPPRVPDGPRRLITVARLVEKKGVDTVLRALGHLDGVRYDVYGDGPLRAALVEQSGDLPATFHGAVTHDVAVAAIADADVAVLACRPAADGDLDGIPVFLMEAAARGVPVVTTSVSGIPELVGADGGWLVPPDDPVALAATIAAALADPGSRPAVLRARLDDEFAPSVQAERLTATWRRLANTPVAVAWD